MRHRLVLGAVIAVAVVAGIALLFWPKPMAEPPLLPATTQAVDTPLVEHPLPSTAAPDAGAEPLPALGDSDAYLVDALGGLIGAKPAQDLIALPGVVRRVVVTVDNLSREKVPVLSRPVGPVPGSFAVLRDGERIVLDEQNFARYASYVQLAGQLDVERLAALYLRVYPLLQQAYGEVGDPKRYFNDRVIAAIDDLLATPQVAGPIELEQPSVYYRFKDPALESRSAGQKLLLRMGGANAAVVQDKLRALRPLIAGEPPAQ